MKPSEFEKYEKSILTYIDMLLEKRGMQELPPELFADMILDLYLRFEQLLFLSILQCLEGEKLDEFERFIETEHSREESMKFLMENVKNLDTIVKKTMKEFEAIYLA